MPEQLSPCPSKTCGIRRQVCGNLRNVVDPDALPCSGVAEDIQELLTGLDRSSDDPLVKQGSQSGDLSLEELRRRQLGLQQAVDKRVDDKGETVIAGQPPCEDHLGRPVDPFGRRKR